MNMCFIVVAFPLGVIPSFYFKLSKRIPNSEFLCFPKLYHIIILIICVKTADMMRFLIILTDVFNFDVCLELFNS